LIDKPKDWTSFDVVAKIRGKYRKLTGNKKVKVGHAGTLDPFATGLLVILVGKATKRQDEYMKKDKWYEATMELGCTSTTGDPEGDVAQVSEKVPTEQEIIDALQSSKGKITQKVPAFSAVKINGQRAYSLARKGKEVDTPTRAIEIYDIELIKYNYPFVKFKAHVSSGTYIRTLAEDIGKKLETGAYLTELRRTKIGDFSVEDCQKITDVI